MTSSTTTENFLSLSLIIPSQQLSLWISLTKQWKHPALLSLSSPNIKLQSVAAHCGPGYSAHDQSAHGESRIMWGTHTSLTSSHPRHWARICHIVVNHQESFNPPRSTTSCKLRQIYPDKPTADSCWLDLFLSSSKPSSPDNLTTCTTDSSFRTRIFSIFSLIYRSDILENWK